ncbi:hypothetical protein BC835DRAFT_1406453 [Cytidiella melzeri]|nr:hypothetical protein BC835DRAFT_1406453 [Cytidiella melzeri]
MPCIASHADFQRTVEELYLLKCSLLSGESLTFEESTDGDAAIWSKCLDSYPEQLEAEGHDYPLPATPCFRIVLDGGRFWIDVQYPALHSTVVLPIVTVKGDDITRSEQQRWQNIIEEQMAEVRGSEFPTYELIATYLLPRLHSDAGASRLHSTDNHCRDVVFPSIVTAPPMRYYYHALLTSHHLISPTKRKNMQQWSSQLRVSGFAKVGYPGCVYCEGEQEDVEEFVANVKAMQWLALRVRFVEALPEGLEEGRRGWVELEKVGEVVEEMRRLGRECFVVEMGIGSAGQK